MVFQKSNSGNFKFRSLKYDEDRMEIKSQRQTLNLLGFFLERILSNNCRIPAKTRGLTRYHGRILVIGSSMRVLLTIQDSVITIRQYDNSKVDAVVKASLATFLDIASGANIVLTFLKGKVGLRGNILKLIPLLKILKISS